MSGKIGSVGKDRRLEASSAAPVVEMPCEASGGADKLYWFTSFRMTEFEGVAL